MISGYGFNDQATEAAIVDIKNRYSYLIDPHGAVGYLALDSYQKLHPNTRGIVLETAHPAKFLEDMERIINSKLDIPTRLAELKDRTKVATALPKTYTAFKDWALDTL